MASRKGSAIVAPTPHMYLYHANFGWPLVDEGTRFVAALRTVAWASPAAGEQGQLTQHGARTEDVEGADVTERSGDPDGDPSPRRG